MGVSAMSEVNVKQDYENMFNRLQLREGQDQPPASWQTFLVNAGKVFVAKDTDYDSRFMRALMKLDARTLWEWEVDKKLDRIRTWIQRGELQVKGEGLNNSVSDLFVYTVQYVYYVDTYINGMNFLKGHNIEAWQKNRAEIFGYKANRLTPTEWVEFLEMKGRIQPAEAALKNIIRLYMGDEVGVEEWKTAIKTLLS
jgi:hypothetical protein